MAAVTATAATSGLTIARRDPEAAAVDRRPEPAGYSPTSVLLITPALPLGTGAQPGLILLVEVQRGHA